MSTDDGTIKYTVKEMLAQIDEKISALLIKLDSKADSAQVAEVRRRLERVEREKIDRDELTGLRKKVDSVNTRLVVFALTVAASALTVAFTVVLTVLKKG